jgi:hypothetical protein
LVQEQLVEIFRLKKNLSGFQGIEFKEIGNLHKIRKRLNKQKSWAKKEIRKRGVKAVIII